MASVLNLRQADRLAGVSPNRLYRAIKMGRLSASVGGGPGKSTLVSREALQAWCASEGLSLQTEGLAERPERAERSEPSERAEHAERSTDVQQTIETLAGQYLAQVMARQSDYFEAFLRDELSHLVERVVEQVVERVTERLPRSERSEHAERAERSQPMPTLPPSGDTAARPEPKAALLIRLRAMKAEGSSLQAIANQLNAEGVPTLSGKGRWQKGTIANLLAQAPEATS